MLEKRNGIYLLKLQDDRIVLLTIEWNFGDADFCSTLKIQCEELEFSGNIEDCLVMSYLYGHIILQPLMINIVEIHSLYWEYKHSKLLCPLISPSYYKNN